MQKTYTHHIFICKKIVLKWTKTSDFNIFLLYFKNKCANFVEYFANRNRIYTPRLIFSLVPISYFTLVWINYKTNIYSVSRCENNFNMNKKNCKGLNIKSILFKLI